jgi:polysaccharide biosynthesis/export protein
MDMQRAVFAMLCGLLWWSAQPAAAQDPVVPAPQPSVVQNSDYVIGAEDVLDIQVWGKVELSGRRTVDVQGMVQLPLMGEFRAAGRTPAEMSSSLTERFQLLDSSISQVLVAMAQYNSQSVTVIGSVYNAGKYGFQALPDLWSAILTAGGPTSDADLGRVQILRESQDGTDAIEVDLAGGITASRTASLPPLQPKDKILVPGIEDLPVGGDKVYVLGAVNAPGIFRVQAAGSVIEAIAAAGGPISEADLKRVYLTRVSTNGTIATRLNLKQYLEEGAPSADMPLQAGDTITVVERTRVWDRLGRGLILIASVATTILLTTQ